MALNHFGELFIGLESLPLERIAPVLAVSDGGAANGDRGEGEKAVMGKEWRKTMGILREWWRRTHRRGKGVHVDHTLQRAERHIVDFNPTGSGSRE